MKKSLGLVAGVAVLLFTAATVRTLGDDKVTITGEGKCAKCSLKETKECQNVIQAEKGGKMVNYYLVDNDVSKEFHGKLCKESSLICSSLSCCSAWLALARHCCSSLAIRSKSRFKSASRCSS